MADRAISVRTLVQGELADLLRTSGFACTHTEGLVRDFTCLLAAYREEDTPLFPEVYVVPVVQQLSSLSPGTQRLAIGQTDVGSSTAHSMLKQCAPLAVDGWSIYVAKTPDNAKFEFGLFRSRVHALATSAEEAMGLGESPSPTLLLRNRGHLVVEVKNAYANALTVSFTSALPQDSQFSSDVASVVEAATERLHADDRGAFHSYLLRFLVDSLQHSHGTLISVHTAPSDGFCPVQFEKSVWLAEPLDLYGAYRQAAASRDASGLANLQAVQALLRGMVNSDGVVVLSTAGTVLAYRAFLSPTDDEKKAADSQGGGRRRTFELMRGRLDASLRCAFFLSQDGATASARSNS